MIICRGYAYKPPPASPWLLYAIKMNKVKDELKGDK